MLGSIMAHSSYIFGILWIASEWLAETPSIKANSIFGVIRNAIKSQVDMSKLAPKDGE